MSNFLDQWHSWEADLQHWLGHQHERISLGTGKLPGCICSSPWCKGAEV